ncbi:MAG: twin-arginine translocase TatA/TatE family subunit [Candidatus Marinimicrobia bacterium]|nr:twin-arginine translocase TatA/TatE family subunit [Candidatus Neomarinimicrobiota bacterium]
MEYTLIQAAFGYWELLLILLVVLLLFGAKKLPELARSLGKASKEFKAGADEVKREIGDAASSVEDDNEN